MRRMIVVVMAAILLAAASGCAGQQAPEAVQEPPPENALTDEIEAYVYADGLVSLEELGVGSFNFREISGEKAISEEEISFADRFSHDDLATARAVQIGTTFERWAEKYAGVRVIAEDINKQRVATTADELYDNSDEYFEETEPIYYVTIPVYVDDVKKYSILFSFDSYLYDERSVSNIIITQYS